MPSPVAEIQKNSDACWIANKIFQFLGLGLRPIPIAEKW